MEQTAPKNLFDIVMISKQPHVTDRMPFHSHDRLEIAYCMKGSARYYQENADCFSLLIEKNLILIKENVVHRFEFDDCDLLVLELQRSNPAGISPSLNIFADRKFNGIFSRAATVLEDTTNIYTLLELIQIKFSSRKGDDNPLYFYSLLYCLFDAVFEQFSILNATHNVGNVYLNNAINYINLNYNHDVTISGIAAYTGVSQQYLRKLFVDYCNKNIVQFLTEKRIGESFFYLTHTKMTIAEIAKKVGYRSSQSFIKNFIRLQNTTPQEYRKSHAETKRKFALKEEQYLPNEIKTIIVQNDVKK